MDYITVALTANFTAFVSTGFLLALLAFQSIAHPWKRFLLIGVIGQFIWASLLLASYTSGISSLWLLYAELFRLFLWIVTLVLMLRKREAFRVWPIKSQALAVSALGISVIAFYAIASGSATAYILRLLLMLLATFCLVLTEQVVRNLNSHRMVKLVGLCLAFLFIYDVLIFGQGMLTNSVTSVLLQGRSALAFMVATALAIGTLIFSDHDDSHYLFTVSRPAAFFSTATLLSAFLIGTVGIGSLYLNNDSFLGTYLFSLALLATLLLIVALTISKQFRQSFEVLVSKHFFALKYDYRIEWLNAIRKLSELKADQRDYYDRILNILRSAIRSKSGSLWISNGSEVKMVAGQLTLKDQTDKVPVNANFLKTMLKESWIFAPQSRDGLLAEHNQQLPDWIRNADDVWLMVPLIIQMKLVGFVILSSPNTKTAITYEDRDLMTNISTQVASHLLLHEQEKVISDAKQMETYNRLSAFIMHDINNVIAQLALIGKNAERHKNNPAFVDDMIKTVHNATERMQGLIQKFNPASKENRTTIAISQLFEDLKHYTADYEPSVTYSIEHDFKIDADKQKLGLALKNLIRNAQEATPQEGSVHVSATDNGQGTRIIVKDTGHGMSQQFIDEELFRPFSTTKASQGVGIGAYLTKSYLEHLGAMLKVASAEGEGTEFEIIFS